MAFQPATNVDQLSSEELLQQAVRVCSLIRWYWERGQDAETRESYGVLEYFEAILQDRGEREAFNLNAAEKLKLRAEECRLLLGKLGPTPLKPRFRLV